MSVKNQVAHVLIGSLCAIGIGALGELGFALVFGQPYTPGVSSFLQQFDDDVTALLVERFGYAGLGAIGVAGYLAVANRPWSLLRVTTVHALVMMAAGATVGWILHWWTTWSAMLGFLVLLASAYVLAWIGYLMVMNLKVSRANTRLSTLLSLPRTLLFFEPNHPIMSATDFTNELIAYKQREQPDLFILSGGMEPLVEFGGQRYRAMLEHPRMVSTTWPIFTALTFITWGSIGGYKFVYFHPVDDSNSTTV
ncbi:DUF3021 family protein [Arcanobacterium phocae]|uniref:DUF3021 family protein n=1 Tax=Arcanobacterium phocae TaxID=131112 RepID=UPI001C0F35FC|nr:DUF3021 family protein [Arcanobacterium phocae]